jgi:radical SAM protein with 4Fe4S-binding SPASM domain
MKRFKKVYIEITNNCNLDCDFCPKTKRASMYMNKAVFLHILEEIKPFTDYIFFHVLGEPLLHPDLDYFLKLSSDMGFKVNITTNGVFIKKRQDVLLKASALRQVNFSLHSFEANDTKNTLNTYLTDILDFTHAAINSSDIICSYRLWNLIDTYDDRTNNTNLNNFIIQALSESFKLSFDLKNELLQKPGVKLTEKVYLNMAHRFNWPDIASSNLSENGYCYGLRDQVGVLVDGTVIPCCLDGEGSIKLGNLLENSFDKIINSSRAKKIYDGFSNRIAVEELCKKCDYRNRFGK